MEYQWLVESLREPAVRTSIRAAYGHGRSLSHRLAHDDGFADIGPWTHVDDEAGGRYVRRAAFGAGPVEDYDWASHDGFTVTRSATRRCVLIGESVARGFHFDPTITPASALQSALGQAVEVLDFACVALHPGPRYERLIETAARLDVTDLVLMAGNNWSCTIWEHLGPQEHLRLSQQISAGLETHREFVETKVRATARRTIQHALKVARRHGIRLVVVAPGFNLRDWHYEWLTPRWLGAQKLEQWLQLAKQVQANTISDEEGLVRHLEEMVALDKGLSEATNEHLARAYLRRGDHVLAKRFFEAARDAGSYLDGFSVPRCPGYVLDELREMAREAPDMHLVDAPTLLADAAAQYIPGREFFVDYCHMSPKGMELVMTAVAGRLATGPAPCSRPSWSARVEQSSDFRAGCLVAGIHNAHSSQEPELVCHWLKLALAENSDAPDLVSSVFQGEFVTDGSAAVLMREVGTGTSPVVDTFLKATRPNGGNEIYLLKLLRSIADPATNAVLDRAFSKVRRLLEATPNVDVRTSRLTTYRAADRAEKIFSDRMFVRTLSGRSDFVFWCKPGIFELEVCARVPRVSALDDGNAKLLLNDAPVKDTRFGPEWTTDRTLIDMTENDEGFYTLTVLWPDEISRDEVGRGAVSQSWIDSSRPHFYLVRGDVASIRLTPI